MWVQTFRCKQFSIQVIYADLIFNDSIITRRGLVLHCTLHINLFSIRAKNAYNHHEDPRPSPRIMLGKIVCMHYIRFALQIWRLFQNRMELDWYQTKNASQALATNTIVEFIHHIMHNVDIRWIWHNIDAIYILSAANSNAMSNNLLGRGISHLNFNFQYLQ